jgi:hypothetical protein
MNLNHLHPSPALTIRISNIHLNVILLYFTNNWTKPAAFVKVSLRHMTVKYCSPTTNPYKAPPVGSLQQLIQ